MSTKDCSFFSIAGSEQTADTIGERSLEVQSENELLESQVSIEKEKENQLDLVPENPDEVAQEQTSEITETFEVFVYSL